MGPKLSVYNNEIIRDERKLTDAVDYYNRAIANPAWSDLAVVYGETLPADIVERAEAIGEFATRNFDSRLGKERYLASPNERLEGMLGLKKDENGNANPNYKKIAELEHALTGLGMNQTTPIRPREADTIITLGGLAPAIMARSLHGETNRNNEAFGACTRLLTPAELKFMETYHLGQVEGVIDVPALDEMTGEPGKLTEAHAALAVLHHRHPASQLREERVTDRGILRKYDTLDGVAYWACAAAVEGGGDGTRANTRDTLRFLRDEVGEGLGKRVIISTNDHYELFQETDGVAMVQATGPVESVTAAGFTPAATHYLMQRNGFNEPPKVRPYGAYVQEALSYHHSLTVLGHIIHNSLAK